MTRPAQPTIDIGGFPVAVTLKAHARARRISLRVKPSNGEVMVVHPAHASPESALAFAERHGDWISRRLGELPAPIPFRDGTGLPFRGETHYVAHAPAARRGVWREEAARRIHVSGDAAHLTRRLTDWLKRQARTDLVTAVGEHSARLEIAAPRVTLRDTTSRWGSCSERSGLSFSWRLILAPSFVLSYVAAHECAHLRHMNHSRAFWRLLTSLDPRTEEAEAWLKQYGMGLHAYGRTGGRAGEGGEGGLENPR